MKVTRIANRVYHVTYRTTRSLAKTFIRFQEYYESYKYRGKVFTIREFLKWFRETYDHGDYFDEFTGFNIPSSVLTPFLEGQFNPLNQREKRFLKFFRRRYGRFYVIGTVFGNKDDALKHEIAHGLFYTNPRYKAEVIRSLGFVNLTDVYKFLEDWGYHQDVWTDEAHSYIFDGLEEMEEWGVNIKPYWKLHGILVGLYQKYHRPLRQE